MKKKFVSTYNSEKNTIGDEILMPKYREVQNTIIDFSLLSTTLSTLVK